MRPKAIDTVVEKELDKGTKLGIQTWVSEQIRPGVRMYQLFLKDGGLTVQWPTDAENYDKQSIRMFYDSINSRQRFDELRASSG